MRYRSLLIGCIFLLGLSQRLSAAELPRLTSLVSLGGTPEYLLWPDDQRLILASDVGYLRCYDVAERRDVWLVNLRAELSSFSGGDGRLIALDNLGTIYTFDSQSGKRLAKTTADVLSRQLKQSYALPTQMAWLPTRKQFLVGTFAEQFGENGFLFTADKRTLIGTVRCEGFLSEVTSDASGRYLTMVTSQNVRIWDTEKKQEIVKIGKDSTRFGVAIDAPFISNAQFDGKRTLIYTVDNSWFTGRVHVFDVVDQVEKAKFDSHNGHAKLDVDFARQRIALVGTSEDLIVCDFAGKSLAEVKGATRDRSMAVKFSPNGQRLAIGSTTPEVMIYDLSPLDSKD